MKVLQVLPSLNSGGVERGTLDFARALVSAGHRSQVMSNGGRLVPQLEAEGSEHIHFPVHAKSPLSLLRIRALRREIVQLAPDVIHLRSRVPAWMVWLALKPLPRHARPLLVSTFHGLYSVNAYSAIMACGDKVIAISDCVRNYIVENYPQIAPDKITVIHRGVDTRQFHPPGEQSKSWREMLDRQYPALRGQPLLLMPGRLSPWKGQHSFLQLLADLRDRNLPCHGLIIGEPTPGKESYLQELRNTVASLKLDDRVTFTGHRNDMDQLYACARLVFNLSSKPEPFGRTVIEALAMGTPVIAWNSGGPAESLRECLPAGLVPDGDHQALLERVASELSSAPAPIILPEQFTLRAQADATLDLYHRGLKELGRTA